MAGRAPAAPPALPDVTVEDLEAQRRDAWGLWEGAERAALPSGLRLVTARLPKSGSVSVTLGVEAGSRFESEAQSGISHVLEHMCFRGSERWPSSFLLTSAIEEVGGTLDGYTHREATVYYSRLPRPYVARALEIICPAGFERYFREIAPLLPPVHDGPLDAEALAAVMAKYGLEMDFGSIPVLVERHGLVTEEPPPA